jgi:prepilin-type N-terminal cleavage/methylation domain-containing protein
MVRAVEREAWSAERNIEAELHFALRAPRFTLHAPRGFTLLEMMLATLVSVMLMGALYVAVQVQLRHAQEGRDVIEQSTLAHNVMSRMTNDIRNCVTTVSPVVPTPLLTQAADASTPAAGSSTTAPASGTDTSSASSNTGNTSSTTTNNSSADSNSSSGSTASSLPLTRDTVQFQLSVKGDANSLSLYISRLPYVYERNVLPGQVLSDLRLVSYWLGTDGSTILGLVRREFTDVTSDEANGVASGPNTGVIIAPEVQSLRFRYFDGLKWFDAWDGTQSGLDGLTPIGPPVAIEITLGLASSDQRPWVQPTVRYYRHVVPILTADGVARTGS